MFIPNLSVKSLTVKAEDVLELFESLNVPLIQVPDHSSEPTQAYICSVKKEGGKFGFYIFLHLKTSNVGTMYENDKIANSKAEYYTIKEEAMSFAESMGLMMENSYFQKLSAEKKEEKMRDCPIFVRDLGSLKARLQKTKETADLKTTKPNMLDMGAVPKAHEKHEEVAKSEKKAAVEKAPQDSKAQIEMAGWYLALI